MKEKKEYPLFPTLSEQGNKEAVELVEVFKNELQKVAKDVIGNLYSDILPHIESDSWINYRNDLMDGFRDYNNRLVQGEHDFKEVRAQIYRQFRDDIIKDLNQDNLNEIEKLRERVLDLQDQLNYMDRY